MELSVYVNGAEARHNCSSSTDVQVRLPASPPHDSESEVLDLNGPTCSYVYSVYRTPVLTGKWCNYSGAYCSRFEWMCLGCSHACKIYLLLIF
jgi:hypothetical protein